MSTSFARPIWTALSLACASVLVPMACATGSDTNAAVGGVGGGVGGSAETIASSSSSAGGSGPCVSAADCASTSDSCNDGTCINGVCQKLPANEGAPCDDGKTCTLTDSCQAGQCTGPLKSCSANNPCMVGSCDVVTDSCIEVPGNEGANCVDDDPCTITASCSGGDCAPGQLVDCSFLDSECGEGACDPQLGCVVSPLDEGAPCNDGFYCTVSDQCTGGTCMGVMNTCVPPGADVCQVGVCNEANNTCVATPGNNGGACNDQNACTTGETCSNGLCGGGGPANPGGACDDDDACTTVDTCNAGGTCVGSASIVDCMNGDGCCPASCTLFDDDDCQPDCCGDNQNDFPPDTNCGQGAAWIAWEYVPTCSFNLTQIELHTDFGSVALLDDSNDFPGSTLFQGPLGPPDPQGFMAANVNPPLALVGGQKYWIAEAVGMCSIALSGVPYTYYASFGGLAGPWDGPFNGHFWTSHMVGECQ